MYPIDTWSTRKDRGRLAHLNSDEVAVSAKSEKGDTGVRIHHPRWRMGIALADKAGGLVVSIALRRAVARLATEASVGVM